VEQRRHVALTTYNIDNKTDKTLVSLIDR